MIKKLVNDNGYLIFEVPDCSDGLKNRDYTTIWEEHVLYFTKNSLKIVSKRKPSKKELDDMIFAFNTCKYVKSNAIVLASDKSTLGIGSGQPSRLDSCQIAVNKMKKFSKKNYKNEIVAASDAFFPFTDGIEKLIQSGVSAVIQPSGSVNDKKISK